MSKSSSYARRVLNQVDRPLNVNPFEKPQSSDPFDVLEQVTGIRTPKPKAPIIKRESLKALVNNNQWDRIGKLFGFEPHWTSLHGMTYFDWTSCNSDFWKEFQPVAVAAKGQSQLNRALARDGNRCHWCRKECDSSTPELHPVKDHRVNFAKGLNAFSNIIVACQGCKSSRQPGRPKAGGIAVHTRSELAFKEPKKNRTVTQKQIRRLALHKKQFGECHYCWNLTPIEEWTIDHVVAVSRGGGNEPSNLVGACCDCNKYKGNLDVEIFEATDYLKKKRALVELSTAGTE